MTTLPTRTQVQTHLPGMLSIPSDIHDILDGYREEAEAAKVAERNRIIGLILGLLAIYPGLCTYFWILGKAVDWYWFIKLQSS